MMGSVIYVSLKGIGTGGCCFSSERPALHPPKGKRGIPVQEGGRGVSRSARGVVETERRGTMEFEEKQATLLPVSF